MSVITYGRFAVERFGTRFGASADRVAARALWLIAGMALLLFLPRLLRGAAGQEVPAAQRTAPTVQYSVWVRTDLTPPQLIVGLQSPVPAGESSVSIQMPVWSPGDYHIQDLARFVHIIRAVGMSGSIPTGDLQVRHTDANTWVVDAAGAQSVLVTYSVPQTPAGIFSDNVTLAAHYAFVNGPAAYAYVVGHKDWRTSLTVYPPRDWRVETSLPPVASSPELHNAEFAAPDYDTLADSPMVAADSQGMVVRQFEVDHRPHRAVFFHTGIDSSEAEAYISPLKRIVQAENDIMGGPPYDRYEFMFDVGGGGGGLEHLNSARILLWPGEALRGFSGMAAHEFFHLWNVKRIRPAVLGPFDYVHPPKTRNLWFAEGVTEYYAHIALQRAGITSQTGFFNHWQAAIARLTANPARKRVSADESSLRVWESGDSQGFAGLSYYSKGELIGLCLDLEIRHATHGSKSLDDVMRLLMQRHNPPKPGYEENEIRSTVSEVAGQDLSSLYDLLARSTEEMPFSRCLGYVGLDVSLRSLPNATQAELALRKQWAAAAPEQVEPNRR